MIPLLGGLTAVAILAVYVYNRIIGLQKRAAGAWADIDAQLKRRHDLVPALVEVVRGYAAHERQTLEEVIRRRGAAEALDSTVGDARVQAENGLAGALRGLFALAEAYPDLRASERFGSLQSDLSAIEDDLQSARRYYNAVVRDLNTRLATFPDLVVARPFGFAPRAFFELDDPMERKAVQVDLDG